MESLSFSDGRLLPALAALGIGIVGFLAWAKAKKYEELLSESTANHGGRSSLFTSSTSSSKNGASVGEIEVQLTHLKLLEKRRLDITLRKRSSQEVTLEDLIDMYEDILKKIHSLDPSSVPEHKRLELQAEANRGVGNAYRLLTNYTRSQAFSYLGAAADMFDESASFSADPEEVFKLLEAQTELYNDLGKLYSGDIQIQKARNAFQKALEIHKKLDEGGRHNLAEAFAVISLARLSLAEGKFEEAEYLFEESYSIYKVDFLHEPHSLAPLLEMLEMFLSLENTEKAHAIKARVEKDHAEDLDKLAFLARQYPNASSFLSKN